MRPSRADPPPAGPAEPLSFRPIFKEKVWGGRRLEAFLHRPLPGPGPYGECWGLSDCGADRSVVEGGPWEGRDLHDLVVEHPLAILGRPGTSFPLLFKVIDAEAPLSVQLHPSGEDLARAGESGSGKSEAWVILEAEAGARIVHGLKPGADREAFLDALEEGKTRSAEDLLGWRPVRPGQVVFLPAGTIHAIGGGILLLEVQEPSDLTYRLHDWGRPGLDGRPRALHLKEARAVRPPGREPPSSSASLFEAGRPWERVVECAHFRIDAVRLSPGGPSWRARTGEGERGGFLVLAGLRGEAVARGLQGGAEREVLPGSFVLVPAAAGEVEVRARGGPFIGLCVREGEPRLSLRRP